MGALVSLHGRILGVDNENGQLVSNGAAVSAGVKQGVLTSAQILALNAIPITAVAAPGAGKALIFEGVQLWLDYNSAAYGGIATGEDLAIRYTGASGTQLGAVETTGFLDQTSTQHRFVRAFTAASAVSDVTPVANTPLVFHMLAGEITTGNSPLKYRLFYRVIDLTWK